MTARTDPGPLEKPRDSIGRREAWDYFNTHAAQRLTIFNFYIALSSVAATGYIAALKAQVDLTLLRSLLPFLICLFAFVFWKLDQRTKFLIKHAEDVIKELEGNDASATMLFMGENVKTDAQWAKFPGRKKLLFWKLPLSYSDCFNLVYLTFFLFGLFALIWPVIRPI